MIEIGRERPIAYVRPHHGPDNQDKLLAPPIYFVRHGETDWNAVARLQGQHDVPLNARGRLQAGQAARLLSGRVSDLGDFDFVASPLARTRETMEILRTALGLPQAAYRTDPRFVELTFGRWEGSTWREVRSREPALAALRERDKWNFTPPEGESYATLMDRVMPAIAELTRPTILVSHGGVARTLLVGLTGMAGVRAARADIWQGRVLTFKEGGHRWDHTLV